MCLCHFSEKWLSHKRSTSAHCLISSISAKNTLSSQFFLYFSYFFLTFSGQKTHLSLYFPELLPLYPVIYGMVRFFALLLRGMESSSILLFGWAHPISELKIVWFLTLLTEKLGKPQKIRCYKSVKLKIWNISPVGNFPISLTVQKLHLFEVRVRKRPARECGGRGDADCLAACVSPRSHSLEVTTLRANNFSTVRIIKKVPTGEMISEKFCSELDFQKFFLL